MKSGNKEALELIAQVGGHAYGPNSGIPEDVAKDLHESGLIFLSVADLPGFSVGVPWATLSPLGRMKLEGTDRPRPPRKKPVTVPPPFKPTPKVLPKYKQNVYVESLLDEVEKTPGITAPDLAEKLPHHYKNNNSAKTRIHQLVDSKKLKVQAEKGRDGRVHLYPLRVGK